MNVAGYKEKQLFITEMGWTTFDPRFSVSDDDQAKYILNAIKDAKEIGLNGVIIYSLKDGGKIISTAKKDLVYLIINGTQKNRQQSYRLV
ncbi:phosphoheptose isomerase family protein [Klebsiella variicola]|uniref:hypothetical protein n=1 Tax=Klebsiella variicola TaxID=244366 RepID=UPI0018891B25|nr:hypothetical protein [Klebsiella variicola]